MHTTGTTRNWIGLICESFVSSGQLPMWDAAAYLTNNLFGEAPNPHFHNSPTPTEAISFFLKGLYRPIVETAFRDAGFPNEKSFHVFIDASTLGNSAVLIVYFSTTAPPHLLSVDTIRPWNLRFPDVFAFHEWAQNRYQEIYSACISLHRGKEIEEDRDLPQRGAKKWEHSHGGVRTSIRPPLDFKLFSHHSGRSGS